jgi:hypothetical protein
LLTGKTETRGSDETIDNSAGDTGSGNLSGTTGSEDSRGNEGGEEENKNESEKSFLETDRGEGFDATGGEDLVGKETEAK